MEISFCFISLNCISSSLIIQCPAVWQNLRAFQCNAEFLILSMPYFWSPWSCAHHAANTSVAQQNIRESRHSMTLETWGRILFCVCAGFALPGWYSLPAASVSDIDPTLLGWWDMVSASCPRWPQDDNKETLWIWSQYVILSVHHPAHFHSVLFCFGKIFRGVSDADRRTDIDILPWTHHLFLGLQLKSCKKEEKACGGPGRSCILPLNLPSLWRWHRWFWWGSDQFICPQVSPEAHVSS